jgi:hypothetical protein
MPTHLDFDGTNSFRSKLIARTLPSPNGPQTYTSTNYNFGTLSDYSDIKQGPIDALEPSKVKQYGTLNTYKPDQYFIKDRLEELPRRANLNLYPYFVANNDNTLIGVLNSKSYDNESELFKFAAKYITTDSNGPIAARVQQNTISNNINGASSLETFTNNSSSVTGALTGKQPLVPQNYGITVDNSANSNGNNQDFMEVLSGKKSPFAEIPGQYLDIPNNPVRYTTPQAIPLRVTDSKDPSQPASFSPTPTVGTAAAGLASSLLQDITSVVSSLVGIPPQLTSPFPSDLLIQYMGSGQQQVLFNNLSYSYYRPDYTVVGTSKNGILPPVGYAYVGDDTYEDVRYAMSDFNGTQIRSSYYLSLMFDPLQAELFQTEKNITQGGKVSGNLTWISNNSDFSLLGKNNAEWNAQSSQYIESLSGTYSFRGESILNKTQQILNAKPKGTEGKTHVGNVIDQTSRVFREGDRYMSRGSAVQYVSSYTKQPSGVEYGRVWTKDRPYMHNSDTMKNSSLLRKFNDSILDSPYNLNIGPMSNGNKSFENSSNIKNGVATKYMLSIENLAWKTSNRKGFTYSDLPFSERGPNGGRVMWFPPYDIKFNESLSAKWEPNVFLGRTEPVYTYQNAERDGTLSFKIVVDHPSILNVMRDKFFSDKGIFTQEEIENYFVSFFAGCEKLDFYSIIRKYTSLDQSDAEAIQQYLQYFKDNKKSDTYYKTKFTQTAGQIVSKAPTSMVSAEVLTTASTGLNVVNTAIQGASVNANTGFASYASVAANSTNVSLDIEKETVTKAPPTDQLKKLIMKTLSEDFYFKQLESTDPIVFSSLKEKLKYFHPGFHSTTPEGLNSRLTFLHQCTRPGDTIPVKSNNVDNSNLDARNTTFGPPPICVLRVGDFFNSKVIIKSIQLQYENSLFDLNPEGIGVQPMIADVTMNISFIGGQGLKEPVAQLQNALSFNFYGNTEVYDYRSTATEDRSKFNISELEKFVMNTPKTPKIASVPQSPDSPIYEKYIGTLNGNNLVYANYFSNTSAPENIFTATKKYFDAATAKYIKYKTTYGPLLLPLFFSNDLRGKNTLDVNDTTSSTVTINLIGTYNKGSEYPVLLDNLHNSLKSSFGNISSISNALGFDNFMSESVIKRSDKIISSYFQNLVENVISTLEKENTNDIDKNRNAFISIIDKLNFIMSTNGIDAQLLKDSSKALELSDFDAEVFFGYYSDVIDHIGAFGTVFNDNLDNTINFKTSGAIGESNFLILLSKFWKITDIKALYTGSSDSGLFNDDILNKITDQLNSFNETITTDEINIENPPTLTSSDDFTYGTTDSTITSNQLDTLKAIFNTKDYSSNSSLNFYR